MALRLLHLRRIKYLSSSRTDITPSLQHVRLLSSASDGFDRRNTRGKQFNSYANNRTGDASTPRAGGSYSQDSSSNIKHANTRRVTKPSSRHSNKMTKYVPNPNVARIQKCSSIEETVDQTNLYLDSISPRDMEAVWRHILSLAKRNRRQMSSNQINQLEALFSHTAKIIDDCHHTNLSFIAYTFAQMIKLNNRDLNNILLDRNFWEKILQRSISEINVLAPKAIVSIAWSFATISQPMHLARQSTWNVSPYFDALIPVFNDKKKWFTSHNLANLSWSCMTCRVTNPALFQSISAEFIDRREREDTGQQELEDLDAVTLCQLANSFAKSGCKDEKLFQCISDCVIPILAESEPRNFSNLAHSFASAGMNPKCVDMTTTLFDEIENQCIRKLSLFTPQNIANLVWAYATLDYKPHDLFHAIAQETSGRLGEYSPQHLCNLAWGLSKYPPSTEIFDEIAKEVVARGFDSFTAQGVATLAHSFATVGHNESDFWDGIKKAAIKRSSQFGGIECARLAHSFATVGRPSSELFEAIERVSIGNIGMFNTQGLSNLAWSFSLMGHHSKDLFHAIAESSTSKIKEFKVQELTMLLLAYSRLVHTYPKLFDQAITESLSRLEQFPLLDLFNNIISFAKVGHIDEKWMLAVADEIVRRDSYEHERMHTGVLWAYATAGISPPKLVHFITSSLHRNLSIIDSDNTASLAWSLASLGYNHKPLFDALAQASNINELRKFNSQQLANMAWAYATARDANIILFENIANEARTRSFSSQGMSNLLWAFASTGNLNENLFSSMAFLARESIDSFNCQALSNIAWAYTVANIDAECLFGDGLYVNKCIEKMDEFNSEGLCQLHQWNVWRRKIGAKHVLPQSFARHCQKALAGKTEKNISRLQSDVVSQLTAMGHAVDEEVHTQSGYSVDAIVQINDKEIAIEVDGPCHFIGREPDGAMMLKQRQIMTIDELPLLSIPYWEWNELRSHEEKHQYLRSKLQNMTRLCNMKYEYFVEQ